MKKVVVLFVLALGFVRAASASADLSAGEAEESANEPRTYTVQRGDRLERLAAEYGLSKEEILAANPRSAYGIACDRPHKVELRDGTVRFVCGRSRVYLIAGKTLIVPEPRILIEAKNVQLQIELVALRAEMKLAEQGREAEKTELAERQQERDDLVSERDDLRSENKGLVASEAEAKGQHDELLANLETVLSHQPKQVEVEKTNSTYIVLAVAITALFAVLIIMFVSYRKGKEFNHLVRITQPSLLEQAAKNKQRGAELDRQAKELDRQKRAQDDLQTKLREEKDKQDTQDKDLAAREATLKKGQDDLDAAKQAVVDREAACDRRETEIKEAERKLLERHEAFRKHVQTEDERLGQLLGELKSLQAKLDGQAASQEEKERTLAGLREALEQGAERLRAEQAEFAKQRGAVEGAMRCLDEDVPALEEQRRQLQAREDEVARREGEVADQLAVLPQREQDVQAAEENLARAEDDLRRKQAEFERSMAEAQQELEDKARGLDDWEDRLRKARGATAATEDEVDDGDDNPTVTFAPPPGEEPDPRGTTYVEMNPGPVQPVDSVDIEDEVVLSSTQPEEPPVAMRAEPGGSDACVRENGGEVALTSPEAHLGTCVPPSILCGVCRREFADRREFDEHRTGCPEAVPHTPTIPGPSAASDVTSPRETGPQIPIADRPSHEESGFYCTVCFKSFSAEEYARDHAAHNTGLTKPE
ncbi:LysM peptidoglycan-binding domain-containing protein [Patescibacteria group bacterium]|nr:LysM peptidoglycan-binding domain-containing protein [Patescibacteria group bacterium]